MATVTFKYDGKFGRAARGSGRIVTEEMAALGKNLVDWVKDNTPVLSGRSRSTTHFVQGGRSTKQTITVKGGVDYSIYSQQRGRRPGGKQPPPQNMLDFVRRRGLTLDNGRPLAEQQRALAFLIGRAIKRRGIKGRKLFTRVKFTKRGAILATLARINQRIAGLINA